MFLIQKGFLIRQQAVMCWETSSIIFFLWKTKSLMIINNFQMPVNFAEDICVYYLLPSGVGEKKTLIF